MTEVLTNEQFWLGVVALVGVLVTMASTRMSLRAQRREAERQRDQERRRLRRDELVQTYDRVGTHAAKAVIVIRSMIHGDVPDMEPEQRSLYLEGRARKQLLMLHGASADVLAAWNDFNQAIDDTEAAMDEVPDTAPLDLALKALYQAFNRHVEVVWPSPEQPRSLHPPDEDRDTG